MNYDTVPRIVRYQTPPQMSGRRGYEAARECLRIDFTYRCAYCCIHEIDNGGENFEIDHFKPVNQGGEINNYENLYWSCRGCNGFKSGKWPIEELMKLGIHFIDPCKECEYPTHLIEDDNGHIIANSRAGEYHIDALRLNRKSRVYKRQERNKVIRKYNEAISLAKAIAPDLQDSTKYQFIMETLTDLKMQIDSSIPTMR